MNPPMIISLSSRNCRAGHTRAGRSAALAFGIVIGLGSPPARSQESLPAALRDVGFDQRLDTQLPLELPFRDESGRTVQLSEYFDRVPVILVFTQYRCPMLCTLVLNGLTDSLRQLPFDVGREFRVVTVSFDSREGPELARAKRDAYVKRYARQSAASGWHFLTGDADSVAALTKAVGFRYTYDAATDRFAHPSGLVLATSGGRIARYFYGLEYTARDLRLGLIDTAAGKIGSAVDQLMLFCYGYNPVTGKYTPAVMNLVRTAASLTVLGVLAFVVMTRSRLPILQGRSRNRHVCQAVVPALPSPESCNDPGRPD